MCLHKSLILLLRWLSVTLGSISIIMSCLFVCLCTHTHTSMHTSVFLTYANSGVSCNVWCHNRAAVTRPQRADPSLHKHTLAHTDAHTLISRLNMIKRLFHLTSVWHWNSFMYDCFLYHFCLCFAFLTKWKCCIAVLSRSYSSHAPEELPRHAQEDGEETLQCWPPRASLHSTGASRTGSVWMVVSFSVNDNISLTPSIFNSSAQRFYYSG